MTTFQLPDLGEGLHDVEIVAWQVGVGDHVVAGQPLVSVETDKAVVEVASPRSGRIARRFGEPGERVAVGAPLVEFEEATPADAGAVVGELPREAEAKAPAAAAARATPAVRALATKLGVDLRALAPSGPEGSVTAADVERAAAARGGATAGAAGPPPLAEGFEPLRGVRLAMARNLARAHAEVAPTTVIDDADVDAWPPGSDVTVRLLRAVAAACAAEPALNAWLDGARLARRLHARVDVGLAVQTEDGLFTPVVRDVGGCEAAELRRRIDLLERSVVARTVRPEELRGATISLSNFGMLAGRYAALALVPPEVAIVGAGRIEPRAVARDGRPVVRRLLPLSLTFDHRAATGREATRFLAALIADLERPS